MATPNNDTPTPLSTSSTGADNGHNTVANSAVNSGMNTGGSAIGSANIKSLVQSGYDHIAVRYLEWTTSTPSPRVEFLGKLEAQLQTLYLSRDTSKPNPRILELGCGAGVPATQYLVSSGFAVTANDISTAQIQLARKHVTIGSTGDEDEWSEIGSVEFILGDMMELDYPAATFDAVVGLYSVLHLPADEQEMLMRRIFGWLKEGGYLLVNFGVTADSGAILGDFLGKEMYWSCFPERVYRHIVAREGFAVIEAEVRVDVEDGVDVPFLWILGKK
ncbi:methyltransferase [Histoplasma capsulatum G186AR]|uniref:Methyltransferase n=2 Tax=Ajellomyces capsulatus TaxID=5037 RepID=C0NNQ4_AJECG|nr:methyltransferase [Histoplasma capsulatum G186AR]EEH06564.1 methyltransferase [Histoplasma capsulatum G186AR]KAG5304911.1 methyltransferase [Histoplasma capsulatum]QSS75870.1 methyltransferase [Histoplasma capsulatum G186AR]